MTILISSQRSLVSLVLGLAWGATAGHAAPATSVHPVLPAIIAVVPGVGFEGGQVILKGTGLSSVTAVTFSGKFPARFKVASDQEVLVTVPLRAQTGPLTVATPAGSVKTELVFVVDGCS